MIKRFINPILIFTMMLFLGALAFVPSHTAEAQQNVAWSGLFFPSTNFSGASQVVAYTNGLSQNWGTGSPTNPTTGQAIPGIPADDFSARFSANTTITGGIYEFIVVADGGVKLTINDQVLIDQIGNTGQQTFSVIASLATGSYLLILDYVEYTGNALIQINWVVSDGTPTGGGGAAPLAIGEVVQVRGLSLRSGPFLGATLLGVARPGVTYPILARNTQEGLFTWYLIQFNATTQGWVSGRYFAIREGTSDGLPLVDATDFTATYDPPGLVRGVTRSNMNFRTLPTQRAPRIAAVPQLPWGANVEILARTRQGGQDYWYQVRYSPPNSSSSYVGWIFAPFVGIAPGSDPIDSVPRL